MRIRTDLRKTTIKALRGERGRKVGQARDISDLDENLKIEIPNALAFCVLQRCWLLQNSIPRENRLCSYYNKVCQIEKNERKSNA